MMSRATRSKPNDRLPELPPWAVAGERRRAHIARVTKLLVRWARKMKLSERKVIAWRDAGLWHDALRDASPRRLGRPRVDPKLPKGAWHGPAAAARLRAEGERRQDVLEAITWHTVGAATWSATGKALYCADYLEPGRAYERRARAKLAARFPKAPDKVLREVVRMRLENELRDGESLHPRTIALWEAVR